MTSRTLGSTQDADLVVGMLAGDEAAFRRFFDAYFPRLYRFARSRLRGDQDECQDIVQATLIKAVRNLAGYRRESSLFTWLCQICRREILDRLRRDARQARHVVLLEDDQDAQSTVNNLAAPAAEHPLHPSDGSDLRQWVRQLLDELPPSYAEVLQWKYVEDLSVKEIGELLGSGTVAAQSMLGRARRALRQSLQSVPGAKRYLTL